MLLRATRSKYWAAVALMLTACGTGPLITSHSGEDAVKLSTETEFKKTKALFLDQDIGDLYPTNGAWVKENRLQRFETKVLFRSRPQQEMKFTVQLLSDSENLDPYTVSLLSGDSEFKATMRWRLRIGDAPLALTLRVSIFKESPGESKQGGVVKEITQTYHVECDPEQWFVKRFFKKLFGLCESKPSS
jgi:hypothetical protein